ncbi:hypothetical protein FACS189461_0870 [Spirochaetia bacterium]|nr:hypothetical protein FACS189461_0870 [Spirochaetia bacterium]
MKKSLVRLALTAMLVLPVAFGALACSSAPAPAEAVSAPKGSIYPAGVEDAKTKALENEGTLVGIGQAKLSQPSRSMEFSERRARDQIVRVLDTLGKQLADDFFLESEDTGDHTGILSSFSEQISQADVSGAIIEAQVAGPDGVIWTVVSLDKDKTANAVSNAASALKNMAPAAAAAMSARDRMEKALNKIDRTASSTEE